MEIDRSKTPAPGCIDAAWCVLDCTECWRQYDERMKGGSHGSNKGSSSPNPGLLNQKSL
jgi:hypothetical protein